MSSSITTLATTAAALSGGGTDALAAPAADVALFQSLLAAPKGDSQTLGGRLLTGLRESAERLEHRSLEFDQSVRRAQQSLDPVDMMKTAHLLADYNHETMLTAKVINKATQSLDQLSKLQ